MKGKRGEELRTELNKYCFKESDFLRREQALCEKYIYSDRPGFQQEALALRDYKERMLGNR